jgi:outer membrane protein OmpA-like peptidoglycan-associated protein
MAILRLTPVSLVAVVWLAPWTGVSSPAMAQAAAPITFIVPFDRDSADIGETQRTVIAEAVARFRRDCRRCTQIEVTGHASHAEGSGGGAVALSHARAEEVAAELLIEGLATGQLQIRAYGAGVPVVANPKDEQEDARNRRVVLQLR